MVLEAITYAQKAWAKYFLFVVSES